LAFIDRRKMEEMAQSLADAHRAFFIGMTDRRERGRRVFQVFVDTDEGITITQCAEISRDLGAELDMKSVINEPYELEVSSPGIDKPLKLLRQYKKNIGRRYKVEYCQENERTRFTGTLSAVDGEQITFTDDEENLRTLEFSKIIESIEELPW
jgi:ribosome maturation factor RimP